jgi:hypothetical protein
MNRPKPNCDSPDSTSWNRGRIPNSFMPERNGDRFFRRPQMS